ncbi:hypothetical protein [Desulfosporosinus hippei]|uniref:Permuted papain-like amidase enzyme, YaeF/YiiX, C92 family n=1 Tax=Desulfosporosinus hippei DSM 8344 TaxID=1121419 RepID=A0A1G8J6T4_9FIRM|nr:hypothetical protein [Desulfosporosinus hippei]SDI26811.1 hypothetical protein SAMN05443529_13139 [Desulfosporosinus hippei DSM 8344]
MIREIAYNDVKDNLKTGDLILFHGVQTTSKLIELIEWSFWSHVGMVVLPKDIGMTGKEPLFWESTASGDGLTDYLIGKPKENGPMLVSLHDRIQVDVNQHYDTHFLVKYLNRSLKQPELEQLKDFMYKVHDCGFPNAENALKYYIEGRSLNKPAPDKEVFCSELTAETFMAMGFISKQYVANGYCPDDFNKGDNMPSLQPFHFNGGARLNK